MLPSVLLATSFYAVPLETPFGVWGQFVQFSGRPVSGGGAGVPWWYAVEIWGDPPHLRNSPWSVTPLTLKMEELPLRNPLAPPEKPKLVQPAPPPPDPTAERIKAIENVILELKARGGSTAVIEQLQHDLDELKAKDKKPK